MHRRALVLLLTAAALPFTPAFAQEVPPAPAPAPTTTTAPPVVRLAPPPPVVQTPAPAPTPDLTPTPISPPPEAQVTTAPSTRSTARRAPARTRAEPARRAAPARAEPAPAAAPAPEAAAAPAPAPVAQLPAPAPAPAATPPAAAPLADQGGERSLLPWLIGGALLLGALAFFFLRRRRRAARDVYHEEPVAYEEPMIEPMPAMAAAPVAAAPILAPATAAPAMERFEEPAPAVAAEAERLEGAAEPVAEVDALDVSDADSEDVAALAAAAPAVADRPWLEFLLRPIRAGTTADEARVEFELTVGNTGATEARDVRISSWMFPAGSAGESEMERMLIDPPAEARLSEVNIPAGDGAKVEAAMALPKSGLGEPVLPVVVADARYTLPDGSEGRTTAAFEIGLPEGEALAPFPTDRSSGLLETVGARLHGEPERI